jgi:hypothetical protein
MGFKYYGRLSANHQRYFRTAEHTEKQPERAGNRKKCAATIFKRLSFNIDGAFTPLNHQRS